MNPATVALTLLVILSSSLLENADAQPRDSYDIIRSMASLNKVVENLQTQVESQANLLNILATKVDSLATLLDMVVANEENQATVSNNLVTHEKLQATLLKIVQSNLTTVGAELQRLSEDFHKSVRPNGTVEGIIAGTARGVYVIPLGSSEQWNISSTYTTGVAFDWNTRKAYWIDYRVGIKRANLDGTSMELLISDNSTLWGLAVDPVTGNFYYGVHFPKNEIRVCDRSGQKCAVVASGAQTVYEIYDIALYPLEGIMFWSSPWSNQTVVRADMNGANARVIISEEVFGICVDEASERLYGSQDHNRIIASYDLNGNNRKVLLSGKFDPRDVAVDGDTVHFGNDDHRSVYSLTPNGQPALINNTTGYVWHIALYGRNKVPSRRNPCHSSACPNVCVLTRDSYTCL